MKKCECGCGESIPARTSRGRPRRFVHGHNRRGAYLGDAPRARYPTVYAPDHPHADSAGKVRQHVFVASEVLGKALPEGAVVHHINDDGHDNRPDNLVICQDQAYHMLLHQRERALEECGHADWLRCVHCGEYGDPQVDDMYVPPSPRQSAHHRACNREYERRRKALRRAA